MKVSSEPMLKEWPNVLTVKDLQNILGVGRREVYHLIHSGELPAVRAGRGFRIAKAAVTAWLIGETVSSL